MRRRPGTAPAPPVPLPGTTRVPCRSRRRSSPECPGGVPPVGRAPGVFIGFAAAQKMELVRRLRDRCTDCMRNALRPGAEPRQIGIEAAEVSVAAAIVREAIIYRGDNVADA